jgi:Protein of unknown function (DUF2778)
MAFHNASRRRAHAYDHCPLPPDARPQRRLAGVALAGTACLCAWTIYANLAGGDAAPVDATAPPDVEIAGTRGDKLTIATPRPAAASDTYAWALDPRAFGAPQAFLSAPAQQVASAEVAPPASQPVQQAENAPLPPPLDIHVTPTPAPRAPSVRTAALRESAQAARAVAAAVVAKADHLPTLFEKLFGRPSPLALAYAAPDDKGAAGDGVNLLGGRYDHWTAVYDISAHKVYLPDGSELEAHSGYGDHLDDPQSADVKDRGVTPPDLYDLQPREALFHGVAALRLIPVDDDKVFGRSGFLAHSYMLGPNGDSNGCVSFKDYEAFLAAYNSGEIKRIAVVQSVD